MNIPTLGGNWVDLGIVLILLFYFFEGLGRGFLLGTIDLSGFLLSFVVALKAYTPIGDLLVANFSLPNGIAAAVGFLLCGFITEFFFSTIIIVLYKKLYPFFYQKLTPQRIKNFSLMNSLFGIFPAIGEAIIFTAFILTLLIALPIHGSIKKSIVTSKIGSGLIQQTQGVEKSLNSIFGEAVNETLTFITINSSPTSSEKVDLKFTQREVRLDENAETTMLQLVNLERRKNGLKELAASPVLANLARAYAKDMFARGFFSHFDPDGTSPFDRMKAKNITFIAAGENLALAPNVQLAHTGLMNSPGHRANILSPDFGKVGIGIIDGGIYGEMFVQEFTD
jgi:uncharacterized protein YkwD